MGLPLLRALYAGQNDALAAVSVPLFLYHPAQIVVGILNIEERDRLALQGIRHGDDRGGGRHYQHEGDAPLDQLAQRGDRILVGADLDVDQRKILPREAPCRLVVVDGEARAGPEADSVEEGLGGLPIDGVTPERADVADHLELERDDGEIGRDREARDRKRTEDAAQHGVPRDSALDLGGAMELVFDLRDPGRSVFEDGARLAGQPTARDGRERLRSGLHAGAM